MARWIKKIYIVTGYLSITDANLTLAEESPGLFYVNVNETWHIQGAHSLLISTNPIQWIRGWEYKQDPSYSTCRPPSFLKWAIFPSIYYWALVILFSSTCSQWKCDLFGNFCGGFLMSNTLLGRNLLRWSGSSSNRSWDLAVFCCHHHNLPLSFCGIIMAMKQASLWQSTAHCRPKV